MSVTVVQNESLPFTRVFRTSVIFCRLKEFVFLRVVKMTRGGEEIFFTVFKFGLGSIYQG